MHLTSTWFLSFYLWSILIVLDNIRDFTDSLILAKREAMEEENEEAMSQLTNTHLVQTLADIFGGKMTNFFISVRGSQFNKTQFYKKVPSWSWSYMVVGLTTTCAISVNYHNSGCEFESHLWRVIFDTTWCGKVFSDLRQVPGFLQVLRFRPPIKLTATI